MARRRKSKSDFPDALQQPSHVSEPLKEIIERSGLTTADQLPVSEEITDPVQEAAHRLGVSAIPEPVVDLVVPEATHVERVRPDGPRKREPGEPFGLAIDIPSGIKLDRRGRYLEMDFREEPKNDWIKTLYDHGFYRKPGTTTWASPASPEQIDSAYKLFNEFSGKTERYGIYDGRGR